MKKWGYMLVMVVLGIFLFRAGRAFFHRKEIGQTECKPPEGYVIRTIETALDPMQKDSDTINVAYYISKQFVASKPAVFYINGGPGASSAGQGEQILTEYQHSSLYHQFIFFDQRGTGCSSPYPDDISEMQLWGARGISHDLAAIVADLHVIPKNVVIWGHSYGAVAVAHFIQEHLVGPETLIMTGYALFDDARQWLFDREQQQVEYFEKTFSKSYYRIAENLRKKFRGRCVTGQDEKVCGSVVLDSLYRVAFQPSVLKGIFRDAKKGDYAQILTIAGGALSNVQQDALGFMDYTPGYRFGELCRNLLLNREFRKMLSRAVILECRFDGNAKWLGDVSKIKSLRPERISWDKISQVLRRKKSGGLNVLIGKDDYIAPLRTALRSEAKNYQKIRFSYWNVNHFDYSIARYLLP
jgi:pimeloyl-ACP methyl ester carboxylesterase